MFQAEFRLESRHLCAHHGANTRAIGEEKVDQGDIAFVIFLCDPQAVLVEETEFRNRVVVGVSLCSSIGAGCQFDIEFSEIGKAVWFRGVLISASDECQAAQQSQTCCLNGLDVV